MTLALVIVSVVMFSWLWWDSRSRYRDGYALALAHVEDLAKERGVVLNDDMRAVLAKLREENRR
jgi:hypothetical protein